MGIGDYTKTVFINGSTPALNASNLNNTEDKVKQLDTNLTTTVGKNVLINSSGVINQREVSGTVTLAAGEYGQDRMKAGASGCEYTFVESESVVTYTILTGSLMQEILGENLITSNYRASWTGDVQSQIDGAGYTSNPFTTAITGGNNSQLEFNNNGTGTLILPKFEVGTIETTNIINLLQDELIASQYYYYRIGGEAFCQFGEMGSAKSTGLVIIKLIIGRMRIEPTLVESGSFDLTDGASSNAITSIVADSTVNGGSDGFTIQASSVGLSQFRPYRILASNDTSAFISLDAEV